MASVAIAKSTIVFDGTKFFWRTRTSVNVTIIEHTASNVFEVVSYEPTMDKEAERVYLVHEAILNCVDKTEIDAKISFAQRNNIPITDKYLATTRNTAVSNYILDHLSIKEICAESGSFSVEIRSSMLLVCDKPASVEPYRMKHYKHILEGAVDKLLQQLEEDKKTLHTTTEQAAEISTYTFEQKPLTVRERWRMPIVMIKVNKSVRLNRGDARIFRKIESNAKSKAEILRIKSAMNLPISTLPSVVPSAVPSAVPSRTASPNHSAACTPRTERPRQSTPNNNQLSNSNSKRTSRLYADTTVSSARRAKEDSGKMPTTPPKQQQRPRKHKPSIHAQRESKHASKKDSPNNSFRSLKKDDNGNTSEFFAPDTSKNVAGAGAGAGTGGNVEAMEEANTEHNNDALSQKKQRGDVARSSFERAFAGIASFGASIKAGLSFSRVSPINEHEHKHQHELSTELFSNQDDNDKFFQAATAGAGANGKDAFAGQQGVREDVDAVRDRYEACETYSTAHNPTPAVKPLPAATPTNTTTTTTPAACTADTAHEHQSDCVKEHKGTTALSSPRAKPTAAARPRGMLSSFLLAFSITAPSLWGILEHHRIAAEQ